MNVITIDSAYAIHLLPNPQEVGEVAIELRRGDEIKAGMYAHLTGDPMEDAQRIVEVIFDLLMYK